MWASRSSGDRGEALAGVANIRFGGPRRNRLFITVNDTLYLLKMGVTAAPGMV